MNRCALILFLLLFLFQPARAEEGRRLRFEGVPPSVGEQLKRRFPFVFDRSVSLSEVDSVIRFLMSTNTFSNIEVIEGSRRDLVMVATPLRRISDIRITGNQLFADGEVLRALSLSKGQTFERKNLLNAAEELKELYGNAGYLNSRIEIDFELPNDTEIIVKVAVDEGAFCRISDIVFETPSPDLTAKAKRLTRRYLKKPLSDENVVELQKDLTRYFSGNRYLTARLTTPSISFNSDRTEAKLTYVIENPYRYEFLFEGPEYFSDGAIIRSLQVDEIYGIAESPAPDLADRVRRLYHSAGFANVDVQYQEKVFERLFKRQVRFKIKEGPRVKIRQIEVIGNISRPESYYAKYIRRNSSDLISRGYYNRKDLENGYKSLVVELQNQGFLQSKVQSVRVEPSKDKATVTVTLNLDEGPLTRIQQVKFEGNKAFSDLQLTELLKVKSNAPLSLKELEESIQMLKAHYQTAGYLEMQILNEDDKLVNYNKTHTQAQIEFHIHEGPKVVVSSIDIQGNSFTKDYVILREIEFEIGDTLTPQRIEDSVARLQNMGLFSKVGVRTLEEGTNISQRTAMIDVAERDPGLFTSGVGVTNERNITYRSYLGLAYRNWAGTARALSGRVDLRYADDKSTNFLENRIAVGYLEPYIFRGRNRGRLNLIREQKAEDERQNDEVIIRESNEIQFLIERDLGRRARLTWNAWSFANIRKFERQDYRTTETRNIATVGPTLELDFRDDPFNPTQGTFSRFTLEYSDPAIGSTMDSTQTIHFLKSTASMTHYQRLGSPRFVWANQVRGGYLSNLSSRDPSGVPDDLLFRLGGRSTIRGFDGLDERIPNNAQLGISDGSRYFLKDDSYFSLVKSEIRFPIYGLLSGALFYDGGAVTLRGTDLGDRWRDSAGFALRVNTPVGPFNIECGFKLDRKPFESEKAWHVSIGAF